MDRVTRRSAMLSLILHGVLVAAAWIGIGPPSRLPPDRLPRSTPTPPTAIPTAPPLPALGIPAEDAVLQPPPLPALTPGMAGLPPLPIVRPKITERPGDQRSRGRAGPDTARVELPAIDERSDVASRIARGSTTNEDTDQAEKVVLTAQWHLENRIASAYRSAWRQYATQVTNRRLVVWVVANAQGKVVRGGLFACTTGCTALDEAIGRLLVQPDFGLPPIATGVTTYFQVTLP